MAVLRPSAALLLSCALLAGGSVYHRQQEPVQFVSEPVAEWLVPAPLDCAYCCRHQTGCLGFTLSLSGECRLYDTRPLLSPDPDHTPPDTFLRSSIAPCPPDWLLFRDRCFYRFLSEERLDWVQHRAACKSRGERVDLAVPNDAQEASWLTHHPSRTEESEYTGLKLEDDTFFDLDGSVVPVSLQMSDSILRPDDGYVNLRTDRQADFYVRPAAVTLPASVCETPSRECPREAPCPSDWLALDSFCYHHVSTSLTWQDADDHCAALKPGARLAPVVDMGTFLLLYHSLSLPGPVWAGLSDAEEEGSWKAVDNSDSYLDWQRGEPNGGTDENCMDINVNGVNDQNCTAEYEFLCRLPLAICIK